MVARRDYTDERSALRYLVWDDLYHDEKPYQMFMEPKKNQPQIETTNVSFEAAGPELIRDVCGHGHEFNLDDHGFAFVEHTTSVAEFTSSDIINNKYLPEIQALLRKEIDGVDRVVFFDWRVSKVLVLAFWA